MAQVLIVPSVVAVDRVLASFWNPPTVAAPTPLVELAAARTLRRPGPTTRNEKHGEET